MKYVSMTDPSNPTSFPMIELTRRNLEILLEKLDDPASARTIFKDDPDLPYPWNGFAVRAVENDEHYAAEDREPGTMYMPTTGEYK